MRPEGALPTNVLRLRRKDKFVFCAVYAYLNTTVYHAQLPPRFTAS